MKGRWSFHARKSEPRLYAILRLPSGKLIRKEIRKESSHSRLYEGFVKGVSGLYTPRIVAQKNKEIDFEKRRKANRPPNQSNKT